MNYNSLMIFSVICFFFCLGNEEVSIHPSHLSVSAPSGAETNIKVGGGTPSPQSAWKKFFGLCFSILFGFKSTNKSRFGERFRDGQYSLVSFLFAVLLTVPPQCPAICKSGGTFSPCPMESAPMFAPDYVGWGVKLYSLTHVCVCVCVCVCACL